MSVKLFHPPNRPASGGSRVWLPPDPAGWVVEPKYNGHRVIIASEEGKVYNRHLEPYTKDRNETPEHQRLAECYIQYADGEYLTPIRKAGHPNAVIFFDIYGGLGNAMERRQALLNTGFPVHDPFEGPPVNLPPATQPYIIPQYPASSAEELFQTLQLLSDNEIYEGIVLKQTEPTYRNARWIKFRFDQYK